MLVPWPGCLGSNFFSERRENGMINHLVKSIHRYSVFVGFFQGSGKKHGKKWKKKTGLGQVFFPPRQ